MKINKKWFLLSLSIFFIGYASAEEKISQQDIDKYMAVVLKKFKLQENGIEDLPPKVKKIVDEYSANNALGLNINELPVYFMKSIPRSHPTRYKQIAQYAYWKKALFIDYWDSGEKVLKEKKLDLDRNEIIVNKPGFRLWIAAPLNCTNYKECPPPAQKGSIQCAAGLEVGGKIILEKHLSWWETIVCEDKNMSILDNKRLPKSSKGLKAHYYPSELWF